MHEAVKQNGEFFDQAARVFIHEAVTQNEESFDRAAREFTPRP